MYVFNRGNAPAIYGKITIPPKCYEALPDDIVARLKTTSLPLIFEGDPEFVPLWVTNIPKKTPNQIL